MFRTILPVIYEHLVKNGYTKEIIGLEPDGRPPSFSGDIYIAVHPGPIHVGPTQESTEWGLDELFHFYITITKKVGIFPQDDRYTPLAEPLELQGVYAHERKIKTLITNSWPTLICQMNTNLDDTTDNESKLTLMAIRWLGTTDPEVQGPSWFGSDPHSDNPEDGFSIRLEFGPIRRVQSFLTGYPIV